MINAVVTETGPLLTLEEARLHLRTDGEDENTLIEAYADAAVLSCLNHCAVKLVPQGAEPAFKAAALLVLGDLYGNRSEVIAGESYDVSPTVSNLLRAYRLIRI